MTSVAIAHDYLTQKGGAERVVLLLARAFPDAPIFTSLLSEPRTYPEFGSYRIHVTRLNSARVLRRHHHWAFPLLPAVISRVVIDAEITICSSSGWAHGVAATGRKIVYCHTPARWLYQYGAHTRRPLSVPRRLALLPAMYWLRQWDSRAALSADRYIANSRYVAHQIEEVYGVTADVISPPPALGPGVQEVVPNLPERYFLIVSRLVPYKNVDKVIAAAELMGFGLVVVGAGPDRTRLRRLASSEVLMLNSISDAQLRYLYDNCLGVIGAGYEDFGLSVLEASSFGKPVAALRFGGYLETVIEGETGIFFDSPDPHAIASALSELVVAHWDRNLIYKQAARYSEARFIEDIRRVVVEETTCP